MTQESQSPFSNIETPRIILRNWTQQDLPGFAEINSDFAVTEFLPKSLTRDESDLLADKIKDHFNQHGFGLFATELKTTGEFIGFVGLSRPHFEAHFTPCVEIGWRLSAKHWGQGYATEAATAALKYGFETLDLNEIYSFTVPQNLRSRRVMQKLGFSHNSDEDFDHPSLEDQSPLKRHVLYRLNKKNWNLLD